MQTPNHWAQLVRQCCEGGAQKLPELITQIQAEAAEDGFRAAMRSAGNIVTEYQTKRFADNKVHRRQRAT
ncbi:hypothetical protein [Silvimonas sp.]|uniref:hypothetical protein n=1 Tax=Silvimonas sp. TaxID=2650811 RepID=UPI00284A0ECD|nr:hypothetical protein [Silvimonas sp.]MDR3427777.1 hypothetical protein [Silvimonas sp.]